MTVFWWKPGLLFFIITKATNLNYFGIALGLE